jgi:uncharacterized membrane protein
MKISTFVIRIWRMISVAVVFGLSVFSYTLFPSEVAVHFDALGQADRFIQKSNVFYVVMGLILVNNVLLMAFSKRFLTLPTHLLPIPNQESWTLQREVLNEHLKNWFYCLMAAINTITGLGMLALASVNNKQFAYNIGNFDWIFYLAFAMLFLILVALPLRLFIKPTPSTEVA